MNREDGCSIRGYVIEYSGSMKYMKTRMMVPQGQNCAGEYVYRRELPYKRIPAY